MNATVRAVCWLSLCMISLSPARAQESQKPAAASFAAAYRSDLLKTWDDFSGKIVALAEAMPEAKYTWRPTEGVRSVGEVYTHIASANYMLPQMAGVQPPAGVDVKGIDSLKDKAAIVATLKQSCEHVKQALSNTSDADFDKPVNIFGRDATVREAYLLLVTHQPEHLGQSIAYARMNGVVPPWTAERQARQQESKSK
jgi:uncharacterized damage-inducible protein DinB